MEVQAPSAWRTVDFLSDLHLHAKDTATLNCLCAYLTNTTADAVFILGDLFEVWIGDDILDSTDTSFEESCCRRIKKSACNADLYIMKGNRDFLMGPRLCAAIGASELNDPTVLEFGGIRWLLTHGDALCLADTAYQAFRSEVRSQDWQQRFLDMPIAQRQAIAQSIRQQSEQLKKTHTTYADVDAQAAVDLMRHLNAPRMIHGHTHRPGLHYLTGGYERHVLSDWDQTAQPPRAEILRINLQSSTEVPTVHRVPLPPKAPTE